MELHCREDGAWDDKNFCVRHEVVHHTVHGEVNTEGWPYGTTHDMDCPGCQDTPFTASPRSETYWAS